MLGFLNLPGGTDDTPRWQPLNSFNPIALGVGAKREYVQIVDINGDGKADYLYVHPEQGVGVRHGVCCVHGLTVLEGYRCLVERRTLYGRRQLAMDLRWPYRRRSRVRGS